MKFVRLLLLLFLLTIFTQTACLGALLLPLTPVTVNQTYVGTSGTPNWYWNTIFPSIASPSLLEGYDVLPDVLYGGWCVSASTQPANSTQQVTLFDVLNDSSGYSRIDNYQKAWRSIAWFINNIDSGGTGSGDSSTYQKTIWTILAQLSYPDMNSAHNFYTDAAIKTQVDNAIANGELYVHKSGDDSVVLLRSVNGQNTIIKVPDNTTPEPSTMALLGVGLLTVWGYSKQRYGKNVSNRNH